MCLVLIWECESPGSDPCVPGGVFVRLRQNPNGGGGPRFQKTFFFKKQESVDTARTRDLDWLICVAFSWQLAARFRTGELWASGQTFS